jgi:hypothetical protein
MVKHGGLTCVWKIIVVGINMVTHNNYQKCQFSCPIKCVFSLGLV